MRHVMMVVSALALAGCSTTQWVKPGATAFDFDQDKAVCQYEATKATASGGNFGMQTAIGAGIAEGLKQAEIQVLCMQSKGWQQQRVATQEPQPVTIPPDTSGQKTVAASGVPEPLPVPASGVRRKMVWLRTDGRLMRDDPKLLTQLDIDRAACSISKATRPDDLSPMAKDCMAKRKYLLVAEEEALSRAAELRSKQAATTGARPR